MRKDILERKFEIIEWIKQKQPKSIICKNLRCKPETLESYLKKFNLEYRGNVGRQGFYRFDIEDFLNNKLPIRSDALKQKLFALKLKEKNVKNVRLKIGITK